MSQESARLFLALWPEARVRNQLARHRDAWRWNSKASVLRKEQLHLTLHYIGNVPRSRLPQVQQNLRVPFDAFDLRFGHLAIWHRDIAILRPEVLPDKLMQLHAALAESLQGLDLRIEAREFQPHVTLARRSSGAIPPAHEPAIAWLVTEYALVESRLSTKADYLVLEKYSCSQ